MWRAAGALLYLVYGVVARRERYGLSACVEFLLAVERRYALNAFAKIERYVLRVVDAAVPGRCAACCGRCKSYAVSFRGIH